MPSDSVLLVDDNDIHRGVIADSLRRAGFRVIDRASVDAAIAILNEGEVDFSAVVLDLMLGYEIEQTWFLLDRIKRAQALVPVLLLTSHGSTEIAVKAIKSGAFDFVEKPAENQFTVEAISASVVPKVQEAIRQVAAFDRSEVQLLLGQLSEDEVIEIAVLPVLRMQGFLNVQRNAFHGPGELGRDILPFFRVGEFRERIYYAGQVKAGKVTHRSGHSSSIHTLLDECKSVLATTFIDKFDGSRKRVDRCLAVVSGSLTTDARRVLEESTEGGREIILIEGDDIIDLLREFHMLERFRHAASKTLRARRS